MLAMERVRISPVAPLAHARPSASQILTRRPATARRPSFSRALPCRVMILGRQERRWCPRFPSCHTSARSRSRRPASLLSSNRGRHRCTAIADVTQEGKIGGMRLWVADGDLNGGGHHHDLVDPVFHHQLEHVCGSNSAVTTPEAPCIKDQIPQPVPLMCAPAWR